MSLVLLLLCGAAGFLLLGMVRSPLRLEERIAAAIVAALVVVSAVCFLMALVLGFNPGVILAAPVLVAAAGGLVAWRTGGPLTSWRVSWAEAVSRHREGRMWSLLLILAVLAAGSGALFSRALVVSNGDLVTGYWLPDWAMHLITASSFSVAQNIPPQSPIFSGTPLYYPFLPDFSSAMMMRLGMGPGAALELPQGLLAVVIGLLVISLAERLGSRRGVGVIAVAICFLGGGLGFLGAFGDACVHRGYAANQCSIGYALGHPLEAPALASAALHDLPAVVAAQPRAYDGMPSLQPQNVGPTYANQQWYTPLFGWWVPQRSMAVGFATVLVVLTLLLAALSEPARRIADLALAGILAGLLPLIHVHSLVALAIISAGLALIRWRRAWLVFAAVTTIVAAPRMIQLAAGSHGTAALGNQYPWLEPGWLSHAIDTTSLPHGVSLSALSVITGDSLRLPFSGGFWAFWLINLGVAVPLCVVMVLAALARRLPRPEAQADRAVTATRASSSAAHGALTAGRAVAAMGGAADRVCAAVPAPLLRFCMCCMPIFVIANIVVFQSWDWDNTKLFAYWYLGAALLIGSLVVHFWRGTWRRVLGVLLTASVLATGSLTVLRLLPFHPACGATVAANCYTASISGPYTLVSAGDRRMTDTLITATPPSAVFLVPPNFDDPVPMLTGRPVVMGYDGWLWSYGVDYAQRRRDIDTAFAGCGQTALPVCRPILDVLHRYDVSYIEVLDTPSQQPLTDPGWWSTQGLPVVARGDHSVVYDVRRP